MAAAFLALVLGVVAIGADPPYRLTHVLWVFASGLLAPGLRVWFDFRAWRDHLPVFTLRFRRTRSYRPAARRLRRRWHKPAPEGGHLRTALPHRDPFRSGAGNGARFANASANPISRHSVLALRQCWFCIVSSSMHRPFPTGTRNSPSRRSCCIRSRRRTLRRHRAFQPPRSSWACRQAASSCLPVPACRFRLGTSHFRTTRCCIRSI